MLLLVMHFAIKLLAEINIFDFDFEFTCRVCSFFFYQLLDQPRAKFGPLAKREPHSSHVNHSALSIYFDPNVARILLSRLGPKKS